MEVGDTGFAQFHMVVSGEAAVLRSALRAQVSNVGFLASLREPRLRLCLDHIHRACPNTPSLEELARTAGMSRSALAQSRA